MSDIEPRTVERTHGRAGELVLREADGHHEIIANGTFLMDSRDGSSERALVRETLFRCPHPARVAIGGLGVGFSLAAALDHAQVASVTVVEWEPAVIAWHDGELGAHSGHAVNDARATVRCDDFAAWLAAAPSEGFEALCLDTDNGPDWTVADANAALYEEAALRRMAEVLAPGGVLAVWSAAPAPEFAGRLRRCFAGVDTVTVATRVPRAAPDHVYLAYAA